MTTAIDELRRLRNDALNGVVPFYASGDKMLTGIVAHASWNADVARAALTVVERAGVDRG